MSPTISTSPSSRPDVFRPGGSLAWSVALIIGAVFLAYWNSLSGVLLFDDRAAIVENPTIRQLWPPGLVLQPPAEAGVGGRPFANLSFALSYALSGEQPWAHHAFNILLHVGSALLLFGIVRRTLGQPALHGRFAGFDSGIALAVALAWAIHPLQTHVATYVSQRTEALMAACYLVTLYSFIRGTAVAAPGRWFAVSVVACFFGMNAKEVMATAPVAVLLYDRTFVAGSFAAAWQRRRWLYLSLAATWLPLGWALADVHQRSVGYSLGVSGWTYALTECEAVTTYLKLAFWPHPLIFDYGVDQSPGLGHAAPSILLLAALLAGSALALRRRPALGFAAAWFFLILAPTSSVVPVVQQPIAENRPYLALAGPLALAIVALHFVVPRRLFAAGVAALVAGIALTTQRNTIYHREETVWLDTIAHRPQNTRAHFNLGVVRELSGRIPEAIDAYKASIKLTPAFPDPHANLGKVLLESGRFADAISHLEAALRSRPDYHEARFNLANAFLASGRPAEAIPHYETLLRVDPRSARTHHNLGTALLRSGRIDLAAERYATAVRLDPGMAEWFHDLGAALLQLGRPADAIRSFETALQLDPQLAATHNTLGVALANAGRLPEAIGHFEAALRLAPADTAVRSNLAQVRARLDAKPAGH